MCVSNFQVFQWIFSFDLTLKVMGKKWIHAELNWSGTVQIQYFPEHIRLAKMVGINVDISTYFPQLY